MIRPQWPLWSTFPVVWLLTTTKGQRFNRRNLISTRNLEVRLCRFIGPDSIWSVTPRHRFHLMEDEPQAEIRHCWFQSRYVLCDPPVVPR